MLIHGNITDKILRAFYTVYNGMGSGHKEAGYENALVIELSQLGLTVDQQRQVSLYYDGVVVGQYRPDLIVEEKVIVELKTVPVLTEAHVAQLLRYLKATTFEAGLLLNFGSTPTFVRRVFSNHLKRGR